MLRVWTTTIQDDSLGVNAMRVKAIEKFVTVAPKI